MHKNALIFIEKLQLREDVLAIILFGSWARNTNRSDSDTDLLVILEKGGWRTVEYEDDHPIEITYVTPDAAVEFWSTHVDDCADLWSVAKILYSKGNVAEHLKESALTITAKGKSPIDEAKLTHLRFDNQDQLKAVEAIAKTDPATAHMILTKKVYDLTGILFDIRQAWTPAPKQRLEMIKSIDPQLHAKIYSFYSEDTNFKEKLTIAREIVERIS